MQIEKQLTPKQRFKQQTQPPPTPPTGSTTQSNPIVIQGINQGMRNFASMKGTIRQKNPVGPKVVSLQGKVGIKSNFRQ